MEERRALDDGVGEHRNLLFPDAIEISPTAKVDAVCHEGRGTAVAFTKVVALDFQEWLTGLQHQGIPLIVEDKKPVPRQREAGICETVAGDIESERTSILG